MLSDEFGQASLSWQKFPRPKLAKLRPGFKLGCVNFRCRQPAIVILKSRPEWTRFRGTPPNLEVHFGNSDPLSRGPLSSSRRTQETIRSTSIPAGLHLGGFQPFDRLRDHPFVTLWIPKQSAPMPMKMGLGRLHYHHSSGGAPCGEGIRIRDEETKTNPRWP